jgi:hypothetical protein
MKRAIGTWLLGVLCLSCAGGYAQDAPKTAGDPQTRIPELARQILRRSEGVSPEGVRLTWRALPTTAELEEVRQFGDAGIAVLTMSLRTQNARECQVSLRFLGYFKLEQVTKPLAAAVADQSVEASCREVSLRLLRDAPAEVVKPVLQAAVLDPAPGVRRAAEEMMARIKESK